MVAHVRSNNAYLGEDGKLLTWHPLALGLAPDSVIASLHQRLLQPHGVLDESVLVQSLLATVCHLQTLDDGVESGIIALAEEQEKVEPSDLALVATLVVATPSLSRQGIERLKLLKVAVEGLGVLLPDRDECAKLEHFAGLMEVLG